MSRLLDTFENMGKLSDKSKQALLGSIRKVQYPSKTLLTQQGKIADKIYFIEKGIARTFYIKDGKDITYWIALENDFVGSMSSFFMRKPSDKMVQTLEECELWEFDYYKLDTLYSSDPELERSGRLFANYAISLLEKRFDNLHFNSAKERYDILINQQPEIIQRVSLGVIASYLGITQETLSRIRGKQ